MLRAMTTPLAYSLEGTTAVLRMDDGKANALSETMIDALLDGIARAEREASAAVLIGRADRFCAGFDLKVMMSSPAAAVALLHRGAEMLLRLHGAGLPLVTACTGHALAGGALVLLTGDVRLGARGPYKIGLNEVSIGLPVPVLAMELARDGLSPTELPRATLQARIYTPDEATGAGYLHEVVDADRLLERALAEAARLAQLSKFAYAATKQRLRGRTLDYIRATLADDLRTLLPG